MSTIDPKIDEDKGAIYQAFFLKISNILILFGLTSWVGYDRCGRTGALGGSCCLCVVVMVFWINNDDLRLFEFIRD